MRSLFLQVAAVTMINVKSIPRRFWLSLSTVVSIALVVVVLLAFLAMANGFQRTLSGTGLAAVPSLLTPACASIQGSRLATTAPTPMKKLCIE